MSGLGIRAQAPVLATTVLLAGVPLLLGGSAYLLSLASSGLVLAAYAIGFNVIFGSSGQLFLCVGALAGVSGYTSVLLADDRGWPVTLSVLAGAGLAAGLGALVSWVGVRRNLEAIFTGVITLALSLALTNLAQGLRGATGGETGRVVASGGPALREGVAAYYLLLVVVTAYLVAHRWMQRSTMGWALRALRDDALAAELAGIDVARHRVRAGLVGSAMIGAMGALFAHHEGFVSPTSYAFQQVDVRALLALGLGGIGSLLAPVVGAAALVAIDELLRGLGQLRLALYGAVLVALFLSARRGGLPGTSDAPDR